MLLVYVFAFADDYWRSLVARGLAIGLVLLSFTIITGIGGMVSLAQAAFVTLAGFTAGWALDQDLPFLVALALARRGDGRGGDRVAAGPAPRRAAARAVDDGAGVHRASTSSSRSRPSPTPTRAAGGSARPRSGRSTSATGAR